MAQDKATTIKTCESAVTIEVVGKRPENKPYVWIGVEGRYLDSLDTRAMRKLARQIDEALNPTRATRAA